MNPNTPIKSYRYLPVHWIPPADQKMFDKKEKEKDSPFVTVADLGGSSEPSTPKTPLPPSGRPFMYSEQRAVRNYLLKLWHRILSLPLILTPSFLSHRHSKTPSKSSQTTWLDGLRGIASFIVFFAHYTQAYFPSERWAYDGKFSRYWTQLPIIRLVYGGHAAVAIFFAISGFALSLKSVLNLKQQQSEGRSHNLLTMLSSSMSRRFVRLYLPCAGTFLLVGVFVGFGWFEIVPQGKFGHLTGVVELRPPYKENIFDQLAWSFWDYYEFIMLPIQGGGSKFIKTYAQETDIHLWTIPVEAKESMVLFLTIAAICRFKRWIRLCIIWGLCLVNLFNSNWPRSLFLFGFMMAEIYTHTPEFRDPIVTLELPNILSPGLPRGTFEDEEEDEEIGMVLKCVSYMTTSILTALLFLGLFLASFPENPPFHRLTTGFTNLLHFIPIQYEELHRFWIAIGVMMIMFSITHLHMIQGWLNSKVAQYLGKISFSLYLVHGTVNRSLGYFFCHMMWSALGVTTQRNRELNPEVYEDMMILNKLEVRRVAVVFWGFLIVAPVTIVIADVFWRAVDKPSVKFSRWLERKLVQGETEKEIPT
ncbi:hypothetical protein H072_1033 [Dactylellina haptotyla CBS 200.50]|uniref:Acyltransferase 3 domain-containing protein n=1 Tax=Dactylellina haptotyla (strain CBS 200.50) TaxID=1284197 RepID=S8AVM4_DACHA|nr:hypothetical protein H072_1033 [Dactylellina haptotyla CBS 200.50]